MAGTRMWGTTMWGSAGVLFTLAAACRLFVIPWEQRFDDVDAENRFELVPPSVRSDTPAGETRIDRIGRDVRTGKPKCNS